jgi:hypothetical protein
MMLSKKLLLPVAVITFWSLFHLAGTLVWQRSSFDHPWQKPEAIRYEYVISIGEALQHRDFARLKEVSYEPGYYLLPLAATEFFGARYRAHILINVLYLLLLFIGLYLLGKEWGGETCGMMAVSLAALYPGLYGFSRVFCQENIMAPLAVFTVWTLVRTDAFRRWMPSLAFGIVLGLGLITKLSFGLYVGGPVVYVIWDALRKLPGDEAAARFARLACLALAYSGCIAVAAFRYMGTALALQTVSQFYVQPEGFQPFLCPEFLQWSVTSTFLLIFVGALVYLAVSKGEQAPRLLPALWFLVPFVILVAMPHRKEDYHIIPLLPSVAVISALFLVWAERCSATVFRIGCAILLLFGLAQFYNRSFRYLPASSGTLQQVRSPEDKITDFLSREFHPPRGAEVLLISDDPAMEGTFSPSVWKVYSWLKDIPFSVQVYDPERGSFLDLARMLRKAGIIVYAGPRDLTDGSGGKQYLNQMLMQKVSFNREHAFFKGDDSEHVNQEFGEDACRAVIDELKDFSLAGTYSSIRPAKDSAKPNVPLFVYRRSRERPTAAPEKRS